MTELFVSDLADACAQPELVSRCYDDRKWLVYDYSTETFAGQALFCGPWQDAPEIRIRLNRRGWHRLYLGIHYGMVAWPLESRAQLSASASTAAAVPLHILRVRLSGDTWRDMIEPEYPPGKRFGRFIPPEKLPPFRTVNLNTVDEVYWRAANLDGQYLCISPHREHGHEWSSAALAYIRLVPMDEADLAEYRRQLPRPETKRIFAVYDGSHPPRTEDEVRKWLEPLRDSDVETVAYGASFADQCFYPTKVGHQLSDVAHYLSVANRRPLPPPGFDNLKVAAEVCHEMGIECLGSMRAAAGRFPPSHLPQTGRSFFHEHPEFLCLSETGERVGHFSLAFPEVRAMQIAIMRDYFDGRDLDGVHYHFNRCYPFVLCEEPVVRDFQKQFGEDPRKLPFTDERWLRHRCGYVTTFLREVRAMLNELGRPLKLCLTIPNSLENSFLNACDLRTWIAERLVDGLHVHPCFSNIKGEGEDRVLPETVKPIQELAAPQGIKVWADLYPRYQTAESFRQHALAFYEAGIYGVGLWDYYVRMTRKSEWAMARLLGHREELPHWREKALSFGQSFSLKTICGMSNDPRYTMLSNG
jgi:hypothetical protein